MNPINETSMADLLEGTTRKIERLKKLGYNMKVLWECEFHQQLTTNPEMKDFISNLKFDTPLEPRHGFLVDEPMLFVYTKKPRKMRKFTTWISLLYIPGLINIGKFQ